MTNPFGIRLPGLVRRHLFVGVLLAVGVIPLLLMPYLAVTVARNGAMQQLTNNATVAASNISLFSEEVVLGREQVVRNLAERPDVIAAVQADNPATTLDLRNIANALPGQDGAAVAGSSGVLLASSGVDMPVVGAQLPAAWRPADGGGSSISAPLAAHAASPRLVFVAPIAGGGVLLIEASLADLISTVSNYATSNGIALHIVDGHGTAVLVTASTDPSGGAVAASGTSRALNWTVTLTVPEQAAMKPVIAMTIAVVLLALGLLGLYLTGLVILNQALRNQADSQVALATSNRRLRDAVLQDPLTKLGNRILFDTALTAMVANPGGGSVLVIDLDGFKAINDTWGHSAGDALLAVTARRLEQCIRAGDTVARLGGDEFGIVLPHLDGSATIELVERLNRALAAVAMIAGNSIITAASIGVASYSLGDTKDGLLQRADRAMYMIKRGHHRRSTPAQMG